MKKFLLLAVLAATTAMVAPAFAEQHDHSEDGKQCKHKLSKKFEKMDANSDGTVTLEEFQALGKERFAKMDANGDGSVTKEEAAEAKKEHRKKRKERKEKREISE